MLKNKVLIAGSVAGIALFTMSSSVFAQTASSTATVEPTVAPIVSNPMVLQISTSGKTLLRGTIASVSGGVVTVNSWGGTWTINVGSSAQVLPQAAGNDLAQFKVGDFIGVQGTISQNSSWTIDATLIRDWTYKTAINVEQKQNIQSAQQIMKSESPRNYVGVASNLGADSFTLTVNGTTDTVNIASGAKVINRNWVTLLVSSIQNGDNVRVWGVNTNGTIDAQIVRDVSIPAPVTTNAGTVTTPNQ